MAKPKSARKGHETETTDDRSPLEVLYFRYHVLGPPTEAAIARVLLPLVSDFVAAVQRHSHRTAEGYKILDIADAIALSEEWERIAPKFAEALLHLAAAYSKQDENKPYAYSSKIGGDGMPARILAAVNKVNSALVRPVERHNEEMARLGRHDHRYRFGELITSEQYEDLVAAERILADLAANAPARGRDKRSPGRPRKYAPEVANRIAEAWRSGRYSMAELANLLGWPVDEVRKVLDAHRPHPKARRPEKR